MTYNYDYRGKTITGVVVCFDDGAERFWESDEIEITYDYPIVILSTVDWVASFNSAKVLWMVEYLADKAEVGVHR